MAALTTELSAPERIALAVDTSEEFRAKELLALAKYAGASVVKLGLELSSATSWQFCSNIAAYRKLDWIADAKIDDIPNTTAGAVRNLTKLDHPPVAITIHANSGVEAMKAAQDIVGEHDITMLGVTHLTSISDKETVRTYDFRRNTLVRRRLDRVVEAGIGGLVCSGKELSKVVQKKPEFTELISLVPGTRSAGADAQDQKNVITPFNAIVDGATLLVVGRQITGASDPAEEFSRVTEEIQRGLDFRKEVA